MFILVISFIMIIDTVVISGIVDTLNAFNLIFLNKKWMDKDINCKEIKHGNAYFKNQLLIGVRISRLNKKRQRSRFDKVYNITGTFLK